ncbi:hypothetical protein A3Q56_04677 [Intoshia linei]|uniref:Cyclic nucleotide-binding domain-containing protein n=1 Tax=Intoshia linei TaxID=1819745 RepID=A0A177AZZ9_9BILA|nr:hypothetical protein A3Q56_04677 [Intoshia linei]
MNSNLVNPFLENVIDTFSVDVNKRNIDEINKIVPWTRKNISLFKELKYDVISYILKTSTLKKYEKDQLIIRQNEIGHCLYIILKGTVSVYLLNTEVKGDNSLGNMVGFIESGNSFGELALLNDKCVRNASIVAHETSYLLEISKKVYNISIRSIQERDLKEKQNFVTKLEIFKSWPNKYINIIANTIIKEYFYFNSIIVKQGDTINKIGELKINVNDRQHQINHKEMFDEYKKKFEQTLCPEKCSNFINLKNNEVLLINCKYECINEIELIFNFSNFIQTTTANSYVELFSLDLKNFLRLYKKYRNETSPNLTHASSNFESLIYKDYVYQKLLARFDYLTYSKIPLFKILVSKFHIEKKVKKLQKNYPRSNKYNFDNLLVSLRSFNNFKAAKIKTKLIKRIKSSKGVSSERKKSAHVPKSGRFNRVGRLDNDDGAMLTDVFDKSYEFTANNSQINFKINSGKFNSNAASFIEYVVDNVTVQKRGSCISIITDGNIITANLKQLKEIYHELNKIEIKLRKWIKQDSLHFKLYRPDLSTTQSLNIKHGSKIIFKKNNENPETMKSKQKFDMSEDEFLRSRETINMNGSFSTISENTFFEEIPQKNDRHYSKEQYASLKKLLICHEKHDRN